MYSILANVNFIRPLFVHDLQCSRFFDANETDYKAKHKKDRIIYHDEYIRYD